MDKNETITLKVSKRLLFWIIFAVYISAIIYAKFLRYDVYISDSTYNWMPFAHDFSQQAMLSLALNALILLPLGVFIAYVKKPILFAAGICACLFIELLQPLFKAGIFDITTVIAEVIGILAGYYIYKLLSLLVLKNRALRHA